MAGKAHSSVIVGSIRTYLALQRAYGYLREPIQAFTKSVLHFGEVTLAGQALLPFLTCLAVFITLLASPVVTIKALKAEAPLTLYRECIGIFAG
mmetsp:Transcript_6719/g.11968  ORF Transcript_6719/g.11968 Transcript_6719/m.11968 type:complete len:94 (-) Transcript_6719:168-449(-)